MNQRSSSSVWAKRMRWTKAGRKGQQWAYRGGFLLKGIFLNSEKFRIRCTPCTGSPVHALKRLGWDSCPRSARQCYLFEAGLFRRVSPRPVFRKGPFAYSCRKEPANCLQPFFSTHSPAHTLQHTQVDLAISGGKRSKLSLRVCCNNLFKSAAIY